MATRPSPVIAHSKASSIWGLYGFTSPGELVLEDLALAMGVLVIEGRLDGADAASAKRIEGRHPREGIDPRTGAEAVRDCPRARALGPPSKRLPGSGVHER